MGSSVILPLPGQPTEGPDPNFKTPAIPNLVCFGFEDIDPPAAFYIQRDDVLLLEAVTQLPSDTVTLSLRLLLPYQYIAGQPDQGKHGGLTKQDLTGPGIIQTVQIQLALTAALTTKQQLVPLLEGYILSATAIALSATVIGATYARLKINRGSAPQPTINPFTYLFSNYVTAFQPASWPAGVNVRPADGPGFLNQYAGGPFTAGTELTLSSGNPGRVRLAAFLATLVTSATVANRFPAFAITNQNDALIHYEVQDTAAVPASTTITYSLAPGGTNVRGGGVPIFVTMPVPSPYFARNGLTITSSTTGLQVGDQWTVARLLTEEWVDFLI